MEVNKKKSEKRIRLFEAAYNLFAEKGMQATSIDEVARRAGVAKGTFYLYFKDKYDLMNQLILSKSADVFKDVIAAVTAGPVKSFLTFAEEITYFVSCLVSYLEEHKDVLRLINKNLSVSLQAISSIDDEEFEKALEKLLASYQKKGYNSEDAMKSIYIIADMVVSVCYDAIIHRRPYPMEEMKPFLFSSVEKLLAD